MKHRIKKQDIQNLASGIVAAIGIAGYIILVVLMLNKLIDFTCFISWVAVVTAVLVIDGMYLENHFINGVWV